MASRDKETHAWTLTPASIYVFPGDHSERNFLLSTATVRFLAENGFSFDTWVKEGVSWMRPEDEKRQTEAIKYTY